MLPFVCVIIPPPGTEEALPDGYHYVIISHHRMKCVLPQKVKRYVVSEQDWGMNRYNSKVRKLHEEYNFSRVVFASEFAVIPALILNGILGLGGFPYDTFIAFRDKAVMYRRMAAAGVPVPKFLEVATVADFYTFASKEGYPFLVKPTLYSGGFGIAKIENIAQLHRFCGNLPVTEPGSRNFNFVCQKVVNVKKLYTTNGIACGQQVRCCYPFIYMGDIFGSIVKREAPFRHFGHRTMLESEELFITLIEFTRAVTAAFAVSQDYSYNFHLEIMVDEQNNLFFCENACRVGGDMLPCLNWTNIDFRAQVTLGQLGIVHESVPTSVAKQPTCGEIHGLLELGIAEDFTLHLVKTVDLSPFETDFQFRTLAKSLPFTQQPPVFQWSGTIQKWTFRGINLEQTEKDVEQLVRAWEESCVIEKNI